MCRSPTASALAPPEGLFGREPRETTLQEVNPSLAFRRKVRLPRPLDLHPLQHTPDEEASLKKLEDSYDLVEAIGSGSMAVVHRATRRADGLSVAVKVVRTSDPEMMKIVRQEHDILRGIAHPHIIKALDCVLVGRSCALVLEYVEGRDLEAAVQRTESHRFNEATARLLFRQLLEALNYLHEHGILHRDVKVHNVLVNDDLMELKLVDFNCAHCRSQGRPLTMTGTQQFAAPEVLLGDSPDESGDIWSAGLCLHFMLMGRFPHRIDQCPTLLAYARKVSKHTVTLTGYEWSMASDPCKATLRRCLEVDKAERPPATKLLEDVWFTDANSD